MIFVDTGAWFALSVPGDPDHLAAKAFVEQSHEPLATSDFVVDELLTLFLVRGHKPRGIEWIRCVLANSVTLIRVEASDFEDACYDSLRGQIVEFYRLHQLCIDATNGHAAFAFDEHFRQFGICAVLP